MDPITLMGGLNQKFERVVLILKTEIKFKKKKKSKLDVLEREIQLWISREIWRERHSTSF